MNSKWHCGFLLLLVGMFNTDGSAQGMNGIPPPHFGSISNSIADYHPSYVVVASRTIRPGSVYRVFVSLLRSERPVQVRASISRDGVELSTSRARMNGGQSETFLLKVPLTTIPGNYRLRVESNANGALGGTVFSMESELHFSSRFLTILIQTNRAVYTADQTVRIRAVLLTTELKPYSDPIDVNIFNPKGYLMKNFGSSYLNVGVGSFSYQLPLDPNRGWWTVEVVTQGQSEKKRILVEKYYVPRIEVFMQMPVLALDTDTAVSGTANGWYLNNAPVIGNATLRVYVSSSPSHYRVSDTRIISETIIEEFTGSYSFDIQMADIERMVHSLPGSEITAELFLTDRRLDLHTSGYSKTRIINGNVKVTFLGAEPKIFKPGMKYTVYLTVSYSDYARLPEEKLQLSKIHIGRTVTRFSSSGLFRLPDISDRVPEDGVYKLDLDIPFDAQKIVIKAVYEDPEDTATAEMTAYAYRSADERRLQVSTSTQNAAVGEYVVIHVRSNFFMKTFDYIVSSKGIVVHTGTETIDSATVLIEPLHTFVISLSSEMAPSCRIVVYHVTMDGFLLSDSVTIPVSLKENKQFDVNLSNLKDKTGNTVEFRVSASHGEFIAVSAQDADTSCVNCGQEITKASVLENLHSFDDDAYKVNKVLWASRNAQTDKINYFTTGNYGVDEKDTFTQAGLLLFTDAYVETVQDICGNNSGFLPCLDGTCFPAMKVCDGIKDCANGFDESNCSYTKEPAFDLQQFRIYRMSRFDQFYDSADGDWAWFELNSNGFDASYRLVPNRASSWTVNAFHTSKEGGLTIFDSFLEYVGTKPFCITVELPSTCRLGEQVGVRVEIFNFGDKEVFAFVVLGASDDYHFVHVEADGIVNSYSARTSTGEHQHLIWVQPGKSFPVFIPIKPTRVGDIDIVIEAWTHVGMDRAEVTLTVEPEGITQYLHTSLMLDLKNQPMQIKFMDINVTESPIVPYFKWRRYLYDSPQAHVTIVGDVFGPVFPDMPVNTELLLRKPDRTGEMQLFNFGSNLWMVKYLRLTNQLDSDTYAIAMEHLTYYLAYALAFQHEDGYFTMFKIDEEGSVWLTALAARVLQQGRFPDWENDFYVDPQIITDAIEWLLKWQTPEGSFMETSLYPFDRKMDLRSPRHYHDSVRYRNISLTAHVLLTLCDVYDLPGELRTKASNAKSLAVQYLERHLPDLIDPYELAIVTYALTKANSGEKDLAFSKLDSIKIEQEGHVYWAREKSDPVDIIMENQRPYIQPRLPKRFDALGVEATSYALLVYVMQEGLIQENIVRWLNTMRFTDGGFISTQDTLVAMQALTEYSFRARLREITNMNVEIEASSVPDKTEYIHIFEENLAKMKSIQIENVWGHINVAARGSGLAVLQMDVQYGVDQDFLIIQPPMPSFDLLIKSHFSGKNSSIIQIRSCQRWTLLQEAPASGMAILELQLPTGYYLYQEVLNEYVKSRRVPKLQRAKINPRAIIFYFKYLDDRMTCIDFTLQRWYPVANMSQYLKARVYDYYAPEYYNETMFRTYTLFSLNICEVCGSYQCPYCPFFSWANIIKASSTVLIICWLMLFFHTTYIYK